MNDEAKPRQADAAPTQALAYVLGSGGVVGRSRVMRDWLAIWPFVALNAVVCVAVYAALLSRGKDALWDTLLPVGSAFALLPVMVAMVLVSLRDHDQPITLSVFVTGVAAAIVVAVLSATRIFVTYSGALACIILTSSVMIAVARRLQRATSERVALLAFGDADRATRLLGPGVTVLNDPTADISPFDRLLIDPETHHSALWSRLLMRAYMRRITVAPWVQFLERRRGRVDLDAFDLADIVVLPGQLFYSRLKRLIDIVVVLALIPLWVPLAIGLFVYVKIVSRGPALFLQERRGLGGRNFTMYKFRSMRLNAGPAAVRGPYDDRVLPGMRLIRRLRFDELPQLINILKGDMSLVGPRPEALALASAYERADPRFVDRLAVRPGLTGWAQVNAAASATLEEAREKLAYDLYYIKHISLDLDLLILLRTLRTLVVGVRNV